MAGLEALGFHRSFSSRTIVVLQCSARAGFVYKQHGLVVKGDETT
jgi:hypothetical protein